MKGILCLMGLAVLAGLVGIALMPGQAAAQLVCYEWDIFPNERFKLDIKPHSPLSVGDEEKKFTHPRQDAHSVHGKHVGVCRGRTMATVTGTIVTATPGAGNSTNTGAHLGLRTHSVRVGGTPPAIFCKEVTLDCTATSEKGTTAGAPVPPQAPTTWTCSSRNEWDVTHTSPSHLTKVDERKDPFCSFFQNGTPSNPATAGASGLAKP